MKDPQNPWTRTPEPANDSRRRVRRNARTREYARRYREIKRSWFAAQYAGLNPDPWPQYLRERMPEHRAPGRPPKNPNSKAPKTRAERYQEAYRNAKRHWSNSPKIQAEYTWPAYWKAIKSSVLPLGGGRDHA
jgi:hypothetical protein